MATKAGSGLAMLEGLLGKSSSPPPPPQQGNSPLTTGLAAAGAGLGTAHGTSRVPGVQNILTDGIKRLNGVRSTLISAAKPAAPSPDVLKKLLLFKKLFRSGRTIAPFALPIGGAIAGGAGGLAAGKGIEGVGSLLSAKRATAEVPLAALIASAVPGLVILGSSLAGGTHGAMTAPKGYGVEGFGRGAATGTAKGYGALLGGSLGGLGGALLGGSAGHLLGAPIGGGTQRTMAGYGALLGGLGGAGAGGYGGFRLGGRLASGVLGAPYHDSSSEKRKQQKRDPAKPEEYEADGNPKNKK